MSSVISRPTTARRTVTGLWILGGVGLGALTVVGRPLVGVGLYVVAAAASLGLQSSYERPLFDERDEALNSAAAALTLKLFGLASAGVFPTLTLAWGLGYFEWGPWSTAIALFVAVLYLTYGAIRLSLGVRR
jgi:hypothetical protein